MKIFSILLLVLLSPALILPGNESINNVQSEVTDISAQELIRISGDDLPGNVFMKSPSAIAVNSKGDLFVTDIGRNNIKIFDKNGKFLKTLGQKGTGPGDLYSPSSIVFDGKRMIVWEIRNRRFSIFSEDGEFVRVVKPKKVGRLRKLRVLSNGYLVGETEKVQRGKEYKQERILVLFNTELREIGIVYQHKIQTRQYIHKPRRMRIVLPYPALVSWDVLNDGRIVIGFQDNNKIEFYDSGGQVLSSFVHEFSGVVITESDKENFFKGVIYSVNAQEIKKTPDYIVEATKFPKYKPLFSGIVALNNGSIWVFPAAKNSNKTVIEIDSFDSKGSFKGRINLSGIHLGYNPLFLKNKMVWTIGKDDDDEPVLIKYLIE